MNPFIDLSPFGTARLAVDGDEHKLLRWLTEIRQRLAESFNVEEEVAFLAWEISRWPAGLTLEERRALVVLVLTALVVLRQGSTRLPLHGAGGQAIRLGIAAQLLDGGLVEPGFDAVTAVARADTLIESGRAGLVVGKAGEFKPLVVRGDDLYLQKMLALEERFAEALLGRMAQPDAGWAAAQIEAAVADVRARPAYRGRRPIPLSDDQVAAIDIAVSHPLAVISGGPGTGKTTIVLAILRVLARLGIPCEDMLLAAPTGKAAHRLGQAVRAGLAAIADPATADPAPEDRALDLLAEPVTLHRLLGYSKPDGRFRHHENNRLSGRVVVVDEASMIDLVLMERLVRSLDDHMRLILLGDDRQLPSVDAGAVLRDLVVGDAGESPLGPRAVRLSRSHRMNPEDHDGRNILAVSRALDQGPGPGFATVRSRDDTIVERASVADVAFHGVELLEAPEGSDILAGLLDRWHAEVIRDLDGYDELVNRAYRLRGDGFDQGDHEPLRRMFEHFDRARILCLTRARPTGSERINAMLHERARGDRALRRAGDLFAGEPVMMQVNDYDRGIFNGDQGIVLKIAGRKEPMAVFPHEAGYRAFSIGSLKSNLRRSHAMTVHKAQGSEFEQVALVLPDEDIPLNTREILYTALTRSRTAVTIVGTREILTQGFKRRIDRSSGLAAMLRGGTPVPGSAGVPPA